MRRSGDAPWEMWAIIIGIVVVVALPIVVGVLFFKIYRTFKPFEVAEEVSLATLGDPDRDSFFRVLLVGWGICGPIFYLVYSSGVPVS